MYKNDSLKLISNILLLNWYLRWLCLRLWKHSLTWRKSNFWLVRQVYMDHTCTMDSYKKWCIVRFIIIRFHSNFSSNENKPSEKFKFSFALILFQMLFTYLLSEFMCNYFNITFVCSLTDSLKLGGYNFISMFGSNTALKMVSYPLQALTKSCKY